MDSKLGESVCQKMQPNYSELHLTFEAGWAQRSPKTNPTPTQFREISSIATTIKPFRSKIDRCIPLLSGHAQYIKDCFIFTVLINPLNGPSVVQVLSL